MITWYQCKPSSHGKRINYRYLAETPIVHICSFPVAFPAPFHLDLGFIRGRHEAVFTELDPAVGTQTKLLVPAVTMARADSQYMRSGLSAQCV